MFISLFGTPKWNLSEGVGVGGCNGCKCEHRLGHGVVSLGVVGRELCIRFIITLHVQSHCFSLSFPCSLSQGWREREGERVGRREREGK